MKSPRLFLLECCGLGLLKSKLAYYERRLHWPEIEDADFRLLHVFEISALLSDYVYHMHNPKNVPA